MHGRFRSGKSNVVDGAYSIVSEWTSAYVSTDNAVAGAWLVNSGVYAQTIPG